MKTQTVLYVPYYELIEKLEKAKTSQPWSISTGIQATIELIEREVSQVELTIKVIDK